ncbi:MAG: helix-turn-helix domain-containing protein, partial [Chloroflexota bacterium]
MGESGAFGQALRLQRREAGLTQEQLAERAGLSARGISDLERGLKRPRRDTLALLAGALSWTADERRRWEVSPAHSRGVQGAARVHLPAELTSFVGREDEVQELLQLLRRDGLHLVTLTGVGGVGKTRLAIRLARELAGDFTDGTWFVDLAPLAQPELVAQ